MKKQIHALYSGRVQGVGFRITAEETARQLGVVGWVKNLRDGRVELLAEGEKAALERFLQELRQGHMGRFIQDVEVRWAAPTDAFDEFEIRY